MNRLICGDVRELSTVPDESVDLAIFSPPYNCGILYDTHFDDLTLNRYLRFMRQVFQTNYRVLKPGGRMCINTANTDRKPYIPLASYFSLMCIDMGFIMRGELIWDRGPSVGVSTSWGSFCSYTNPTLRDTHEYILVFSKHSLQMSKPVEADITSEEFVSWTKSVWEIQTESARKVGHPSPFPVELPRRLIKLYTGPGMTVFDGMMGAGATCIAAKELGRKYIGVDISLSYCNIAAERIGHDEPIEGGIQEYEL